MTIHEKKSLWEIAGSILAFGAATLYALVRTKGLEASDMNSLPLWGSLFIVFIVLSVACRILVNVAFRVVDAAGKREAAKLMEDERDQLIELKAIRNAYYASGIIIALALSSLALGVGLKVLFIALWASALVSEIIEGVGKFVLYRRGM